MPFGPEEDLRAVLTDAIYQEGAEHGPYERFEGPSRRVRQIEMDLLRDSIAGGRACPWRGTDWRNYRHNILISN